MVPGSSDPGLKIVWLATNRERARPLAAFTCENRESPTGSDDSWRPRTSATRSCICGRSSTRARSAGFPTASCSSGSPPAAVSRESRPLLHWSAAMGRWSCVSVVPCCARSRRGRRRISGNVGPGLQGRIALGTRPHWPRGCTRRPTGLRWFTNDRRHSAARTNTGRRAPARIAGRLPHNAHDDDLEDHPARRSTVAGSLYAAGAL